MLFYNGEEAHMPYYITWMVPEMCTIIYRATSKHIVGPGLVSATLSGEMRWRHKDSENILNSGKQSKHNS